MSSLFPKATPVPSSRKPAGGGPGSPGAAPAGQAWGRGSLATVVCGLLALTLGMFGDLFFSTPYTILSLGGADLTLQFIPWYEFGFGEMRRGNLALWNPHLFSGMPFVGGFQSALFYPPNLLHLLLPIATAVNVLVALHVFLCGVFMVLWTRQQGLRPLSSFVSAALLMFCGPYFLQIQGGHVPHLLTMTWAPLLLLAVDSLIATQRPAWCLAGMAVIAMMILAGFPQALFTTGIAAALYASARLAAAPSPLKAAGGLLAMVGGAAALAAVQLLPGAAATAQSIRSRPLPFEFASTCSLAPENMIGILAPGFFGDAVAASYWGRCFSWEMTPFFGVAGLMLAIGGAATGGRHARRVLLPLSLVMLLLAFGAHTPLFRLLYAAVPGFDRFRGHSKFIFPAALFLTMLAGIGFDRLLRAGRRPFRLPLFLALALAAATVAAAAAWALAPAATGEPPNWWRTVPQMTLHTGESFLPPETYADDGFLRSSAAGALRSLRQAAGALALAAALICAARTSRPAVWAVAVFAVAETFLFARSSRATFDVRAMRLPIVERVLQENPGDYRILNLINPDAGMSLGALDIWGYDHGVSLRYAEFVAFAQGRDPDAATQDPEFQGFRPLYRMLRLRFVFLPQLAGDVVREIKGHLPRLLFVQDYRVIPDRDRIFAAMAEGFDPARQVILESPPSPIPASSGDPGRARVVSSSTDEVIIEADVPNPSILVVTDSYDRGWRAVALEGSAQRSYRIVPANYAIQAIAMEAGHHRLRLEYRPQAFVAGAWITGSSGTLCLALAAWGWRRRRRARP